MKKLKKLIRLLLLAFLILLALSGVFFTVSPRKSTQDYENEIKTELVEGREDAIERKEKNDV